MLAKFFSEWGLLLVALWKAFKGVSDVVKLLPASALTALAWLLVLWGPVPWWMVPVTALVVFYFSVTAGMAFERALVPSVRVSPLRLDVRLKHFYVLIKNGPVPAKVRAFIGPIVDSSGVELTDRSWEGHWRRREGSYDGDLDPGRPEMYGLLGVVPYDSGNPNLWIYTREDTPWDKKDPGGHAHIPIWQDVPLTEQKRMIINLTVNCESQQDQKDPKDKPHRAKPLEMTFAIEPDPGSEVGYKIVTEEERGEKRTSWGERVRSWLLTEKTEKGHS